MTEAALKMIEHLATPGMRVRTGILLAPPAELLRAEEIAARLNATPEDVAQRLLSRLPAGTRFAGITTQKVLEIVREVGECREGNLRALLVNLDLLLTKLSRDECEQFWFQFITSLPHLRRLLIALVPAQSTILPRHRDEWEGSGRCAGWGHDVASSTLTDGSHNEKTL